MCLNFQNRLQLKQVHNTFAIRDFNISSPVVTICSTVFDTWKFYFLPTECIYAFCMVLGERRKLFPCNWMVILTERNNAYCTVWA